MRRGGVLGLLAASGVLMTVSLYLPWQRSSCPSVTSNGSVGDLLARFDCRSIDGWASSVAPAAAPFALLLAALALAAFVRPERVTRIALVPCAVCAGYFALAVGVSMREIGLGYDDRFHLAYGAYVGLGAGCVALLSIWFARGGTRPGAEGFAGVLLAAGLLVALLLPWERFGSRAAVPGIDVPPAPVAVVLAVWLAGLWWRADPAAATLRLGVSAAALLFTGAVLALTASPVRAYGAWLGIGFASALVFLALVRSPRFALPAPPSWRGLVAGAAAGLFVASLFLPWQRACDPSPGGLGCFTSSGWTTTVGSASAALALVLGAAVLVPASSRVGTAQIAAGFALVAATLGFRLETPLGYSIAYGAWVGLACAGVLVAAALAGTSLRPSRRTIERLPPLLACVAFLAVVVLPWWDVLPLRIEQNLVFGRLTWLTIAGALLAMRLLAVWLSGEPSDELVALPLAMLALAALDIIEYRDRGLTWGGGIVVALTLVLAGLGRIEQRGGLRDFEVPEILRIDRI